MSKGKIVTLILCIITILLLSYPPYLTYSNGGFSNDTSNWYKIVWGTELIILTAVFITFFITEIIPFIIKWIQKNW